MFLRTLLPAASTFLFATSALAAADVRVAIPTPTATHVYDPIAYDIVVSNIGNKVASGIVLTIDLPQTHTSPSVHVMGELSGVDPRCSLVGTSLSCNVGSLARNRATTVSFDIALPQADEVLSIGASATSAGAENSLANNTASNTPTLLHYAIPLAGGETATVELCTGEDLTSFYECTLFPSSLGGFDVDLASGGGLSIPAEPDYAGTWSQTPPGAAQSDPQFLAFEITYAGQVVVEFEGWGSSDAPACFEGITTFPGDDHVSPYRVCV